MDQIRQRFSDIKRKYLPLIKSLQTGLLLLTGLAGYMSAKCPVLNIGTLSALTGSLFLAISGSTALNMWYDRDIDAIMPRTSKRPLSTGIVKPNQALLFGVVLSVIGVTWALLNVRHVERASELYGKAFEHFIGQEIRACIPF